MNILRTITDFFKSLFGIKPSEVKGIDTQTIPKSDVLPPVEPVKDNTIVSPKPQAEVAITHPQTDIPATTHDTSNHLVLKLLRYSYGAEDTLGKLYINNQFYAYTLEDQRKTTQVPDDSCIPNGEYEIVLRTVGGMHDTYSIKYPEIHKGMLWLQNVSGFQYVLIHIGSREADTKGSILVGTEVVGETNINTFREITGSKNAYYKLYPIVASHLEKGGKVSIKIEG